MAEYYGEEETVHKLVNKTNAFSVVIVGSAVPSVGDVLKISAVDGTECEAIFTAEEDPTVT